MKSFLLKTAAVVVVAGVMGAFSASFSPLTPIEFTEDNGASCYPQSWEAPYDEPELEEELGDETIMSLEQSKLLYNI